MDKLNEFEKARLIKVASRYASIKGYEHSNGDISYYSEKTEVSTETIIALAKLALASLTAPPVKLPESKPIHCEMDFIRKEKARSWNEAISRCSHNIRAAGYEVEE